jgi:cyclophilin family peptidyl-prolyl cis-trans isomerase/HEAT repeat protein
MALTLAACVPARLGDTEVPAYRAVILQAEHRRDPAPLRPFLEDSRPEVRARAALALGRIADRRDAASLSALLEDRAPRVRSAAAFALGLLGDDSSREALGRLAAGDDPDPRVRARAAEALIRIGGSGAGELLEPLLHDHDDQVAGLALQRAWRLQDPNLVAPVLDAAEGPHPARRAAAAYSLMRMVGPPNTGATPVPGGTDMPAMLRERVALVLVGLSTDDDSRVRELAARGLGGGGLPGAEGALLSLLQDSSWRVRVNAIRSLGRLAAGFNPESLLPALQDDSSNVRMAALQSLASLPATPLLIQEVERLREESGQALQLAARQTLAGWVGVEFLSSALEMADDPDPVVRASAASILGPMPGPAARVRLESMLEDASPRVAASALTSLAGREGADLLALGLTVLAEADDLTVRAAAVGLLPPGEPSVAGPLEDAWRRAQDDPQTDVRMAVVRALESIPGDQATGLARLVLQEDPDWRVRVEATGVLRARRADPEEHAGPLETGRDLPEYQRLAESAGPSPRVELALERGRIVLELFAEDAPLTVANFMDLTERGYFDGLTFHRVVPNFVIQGGDPRGDGWGGPGHQIRCEMNRRPYVRGTLGMALDGKDTGGSQFFITHTPQPHLDGGYTVFGRVVEGMGVVDQVVQGEVILTARVVR